MDPVPPLIVVPEKMDNNAENDILIRTNNHNANANVIYSDDKNDVNMTVDKTKKTSYNVITV